jgi:hypothetical protein
MFKVHHPLDVSDAVVGELVEVLEAAIAEIGTHRSEVVLEFDQTPDFMNRILKYNAVGIEFA